MQNTIGNVGFEDAASASQSTFRTVMDALSRPGRQVTLKITPACPDGLPVGMAAIVLTLADYETPVWLESKLANNKAAREFIAFHTNAPIVSNSSNASFAFISDPSLLPGFEQFAQGTLEFPDRSTTLVIEVDSLWGGPTIRLAGPGIEATEEIAPKVLPPDFKSRLKSNRDLFPCGVDIILSAGDVIMGLPRSVRVVEG